MRRFLLLLLVAFFPLLSAGSCSRLVRCRFANDCPGSMICSKRGICVDQCKTTDDCHQGKKCIEGECRELKD